MTGPQQLAIGVGLIALVLALYAGHVQRAELVYQDVGWVTDAPAPTVASVLRPRGLVKASWWLSPNVTLQHAVNVGLHLVVGAFVWVWACRMSAAGIAWAVTALFLLHPGLYLRHSRCFLDPDS